MTHATTTAREQILNRLRSAQPPALAQPDVSGFYADQPQEDQQTLIERLVLNLTNAMAEVHRTTSACLAGALTAVIRQKKLQTLAIGPEILSDLALSESLCAACGVLPVVAAHTETPALLNGIDAGLTLSRASIAETGTVVLWSGPQSPRLLSLVPPVHIVVVQARQVVGSLFDLMQQQGWSEGMPTNVVLVSSPSKTADIQQTLAYGAHGPKQLVVMLVEDAR
jgi:L-lactate dehydrogenase complex protein LldG